MNPPASSKPQVLNVDNVSSNESKEKPITFNPIGVCEQKLFCQELGLHLKQGFGFDNVREFCDTPPVEIKIVKGDGNCAFRVVSYLLVGTEDFMLTLG